MNNQRRKILATIIAQLEACVSHLQKVLDEEQDAYDNMPESLQCSDRGTQIEDTIYVMDEVCNQITEAADALREL